MKFNDEELDSTMQEVKDTYKSLWKLAESLLKNYTLKIDNLIKPLKSADVEQMTTGQIRQILFNLSITAFDLGELKDKSSWTYELAEIIKDEAFAISYNVSEGSVAQRNNNATITISKENAVSSLYKMISAILKTKLDECHRIVDALKSILISRASDQKLMNNSSGDFYSQGENIL